MFPLLLLRESAQKLSWQESTFTNYVHLLKAADQLEKSHQQSAEREHKQTRLAPNNNERLHASAIFSLPSVTCRALVTNFFFSPFLPPPHPPPPTPPSPFIVFETDEAQWSKCSETNGEPLFWSFDLWDWKVLHKEQMMTVPTVVLYIIIIPYQLFLFKAATCAPCPYFVPDIVHGKREKGSLCLVTWSTRVDGSN